MVFNYCPNCGEENKSKKSEFKCDSCGKEFFQNSKPTASVVPVYNDQEILMSLRKKDPGRGKWSFVGGFLENGEDPKDGAVREFEEETGYRLDKSKLELVSIKIAEYQFQNNKSYTLDLTYKVNFNEKPELVAKDDTESLKWFDLNSEIDLAFPHEVGVIKNLLK